MTPSILKSPLTAVLLSFLAACAPSHYLIERADVSGIESGIDDLDDRFSNLERQQETTREQLSTEQRFSTAALMQTMVEEFSRLSCDPAPVPQCREPATVEVDQSRPARTVVQFDDKQVVGSIEKVMLSPPGMLFEARIDTGADSSSLDARDMQVFERDGHRWVRFSLVNRETDELIEIERRIIRRVRILQSSAAEPERRPVVVLGLTIGEITQNAEFTLSDRSHLSFPVLIGRNVLQDVMIVDVSRTNIAPPRTSPPAESD